MTSFPSSQPKVGDEHQTSYARIYTALRSLLGARAYHFSSICLHWSDAQCRQLLSNTVAAIKPGYSKVLINHWVLPDTGSPLVLALLDIPVLAVLPGSERTHTQLK